MSSFGFWILHRMAPWHEYISAFRSCYQEGSTRTYENAQEAKMRFSFLSKSLVLVLACAVVPALAQGAEAPKRGGVLTVAIGKDITATNPLIRTFSIDE